MSAERALWLAVIQQAMHDAVKPVKTNDCNEAELIQYQALKFLRKDNVVLKWVCNLIGLEAWQVVKAYEQVKNGERKVNIQQR